MEHHRGHLVGVLVDIERAEPARHVEIDLDGAALPVAPDGVAQDIFELRAVERALALVERPGTAGGLQGGHQRGLRLVHTASSPMRFSGRSENLITTSEKPKSS